MVVTYTSGTAADGVAMVVVVVVVVNEGVDDKDEEEELGSTNEEAVCNGEKTEEMEASAGINTGEDGDRGDGGDDERGEDAADTDTDEKGDVFLHHLNLSMRIIRLHS